MAAALPQIALGATAIGSGLAVFAEVQRNQFAKAQYEADRATALYRSQVSKNNAKLAEAQAKDAIDRGRLDERRHRRDVRMLQARQEVEFANRGLELGFGTPLEVFADTARAGELDALTIQRNAEREALGFRTQASNSEAQARLFQIESEASGPGGPFLGAATTALGGTATTATRFVEFKEAGVI